MTLNSFLCKYFDDKRKGYVTIGDIIIGFVTILSIISFGSMILFVIGGATAGIIYLSNSNISPIINECAVSECGWNKLISSSLIGLGFDAVLLILIYILYIISKIKIARCERK